MCACLVTLYVVCNQVITKGRRKMQSNSQTYTIPSADEPFTRDSISPPCCLEYPMTCFDSPTHSSITQSSSLNLRASLASIQKFEYQKWENVKDNDGMFRQYKYGCFEF